MRVRTVSGAIYPLALAERAVNGSIGSSGYTVQKKYMDKNIEQCPLCGEQNTGPIQGERRSFLYCLECDLIFEPSVYHLSEDEERHRYSQHNNSADNTGYVKLLSEVLDLIRQFGPDGGGGVSVLDYGCGPGPVLVDMCLDAGFDAYGYDPYFAKELPPTEHFDVISAVEVWEHFRNPAAEIGSLLSLLAPDGLLVVRTLLHGGEEKFPAWWYNKDDTHLAFYSSRTMTWIADHFHLTPVFSDGEKFSLFKPIN